HGGFAIDATSHVRLGVRHWKRERERSNRVSGVWSIAPTPSNVTTRPSGTQHISVPKNERDELMQGTSLKSLIESHGAAGFYHKVCELLNEKQVGVDDFSYYELADTCGVLPQLRSLRG